MFRRTLAALALALALGPPCEAGRRRADAVKAAEAAKADFHYRNVPSHGPRRGGVGAANRALKAVVAAVLPDGTLALHNLRGEPRGTLDPLTVPEIVARQKVHFGGRKRLEPADLAVGQRLKVVYFGHTSEVLRVKVLEAVPAPPG